MEPSTKKIKATVSDSQHVKQLVFSLQTFNMQNSFTDLCFVCANGHKVYAHKLLLCTVSKLLKQIFLDIPDTLQMITIHLPDVESRMLSLMLDFLYEGSVRVNKNEYNDFQKLMDILGIVLLSTPNKESITPSQLPPPPPPPPPAPSPQQLQAPQLVYLQTPPNNQGQVQYVLATPASIGQGQMVGMSPVASAQASPQPLMMNHSTGQVMQAGSQIQQNNLMQIVQPSGSQVMPVVQCASQMVVQGNQQTIMANNHMQVGIPNQIIPVAQNNYASQSTQQQPQYVVPSSANQLTTPSRQFSQPINTTQPRAGSIGQNKTVQQQQQAGSIEVRTEDIMSVLQELADPTNLESLKARTVRECLEAKLNMDLSEKEDIIDQVLKAYISLDEPDMPDNVIASPVSKPANTSRSNHATRPCPKSRKPKPIPFSRSEDEMDEDFEPKLLRGKKKKK